MTRPPPIIRRYASPRINSSPTPASMGSCRAWQREKMPTAMSHVETISSDSSTLVVAAPYHLTRKTMRSELKKLATMSSTSTSMRSGCSSPLLYSLMKVSMVSSCTPLSKPGSSWDAPSITEVKVVETRATREASCSGEMRLLSTKQTSWKTSRPVWQKPDRITAPMPARYHSMVSMSAKVNISPSFTGTLPKTVPAKTTSIERPM
mmetsp:Transcript_59926/g.125311  ORF Transcript_59926/g.125311 Transcript_59926/m.125311 type:complete len:206 (-) Transcript_59926:564-1181(-)